MEQIQAPLLSVIIPVYNAEKYIEQCVTSVLKEAVRPMEVLCVDDGSTDASAALLDNIAARDKRVRIIKQSNRSAGAARNHGLSYAKGEFVHFLDADDWLCPGIYSRSIKLLQETRADVCMFQYISYNNVTGETRKCPCLLNSRDRVTAFRSEPAFFMYNLVAPWNKVYRRTWLEEHALRFDEIICGNDRGFYFRMLEASGKIALTREYGVFYRIQNSKALTGSNRYKHLDSLFFAWDTSSKALEGETEQIRAMMLDCAIRDLIELFRHVPQNNRKELLEQLRHRFSQTDFSLLKALPFPCIWRRDVQRICAGAHSGEFPPNPKYMLEKLISACRVWGIRGCVVRLFTRYSQRS